MQREQLFSCANCWYNGLQAGAVGLTVGFCVEHRRVLGQPEWTTCGRQVRADLMLDDARRLARRHCDACQEPDAIAARAGLGQAAASPLAEPAGATLRGDRVAEVVTEYGNYDAKIESLAQLRALPGARAESAMLTLGRAYTQRCVSRNGSWTSGLHLLRWTKQRLRDGPCPEVTVADLRSPPQVALERQLDLATWWLLMLRLVFISDLGSHAGPAHGAVAPLADLARIAAAETAAPSTRQLWRWIRRRGLPLIEAHASDERLGELARQLHRGEAAGG